MKGNVGIWLDHRRALIVAISEEGQSVKQVSSGIMKHIRAKSDTLRDVSQQDTLDRKFHQQVEQYFGNILPFVKDADSIHIFGPGEAKKELKTRLKKGGYQKCVVEVATMDRMTDRQLIAEIGRHLSS